MAAGPYKHSGRLERMICMLLLLMTLGVYQGVVGSDFVNFDDIPYVTGNPHVRSGFTCEGVKWAFTTGYQGNWHPITWLSHMADSHLFGMNAGLHHLVSLLLHMVNTVSLFLLLEGMSGALWRSALVAALFAVHPLHVESVAWISERKDVLAAFFWILSLLAYVRYSRCPGAGRYATVMVAFGVGLMCKPMLVTLPFVFLLLDYWPLGRFDPFGRGSRGKEGQGNWHLVLEKVPFLALSAISGVVTYLVQKNSGLVLGADIFPLPIRLENALVSYVKYMGKMIWPSHLAIYYVHPDTIPLWQWLGAGVCLLVLSILSLSLARRRAWLPVGWFWFLGSLIPVIGIVHVGGQSMADRYTYIPMIGLFIVIAWGAHDLAGKKRGWRTPVSVAAAVLVAACGAGAWVQVGFWKSSLSLWKHALQVTEQNYVAQNMLGGALASQGRTDEALYHFSESLRINPDYEKANYYMGIALMERGRYDEAVTHLTRALGGYCDFDDTVYDMLGLVMMYQGRPDKAEGQFSKALRLNPLHVQARFHLGDALREQGRAAEAVSQYVRAIEIDPGDAQARFRLGGFLYDQGRIQEAAVQYAKALEANPDLPEAHYNMGVVLDRVGRHVESELHFSAAVRLKPDYVEARNGLAALLARRGRYREAITHFSAVLRIQPWNEMASRNLAYCSHNVGGPERDVTR